MNILSFIEEKARRAGAAVLFSLTVLMPAFTACSESSGEEYEFDNWKERNDLTSDVAVDMEVRFIRRKPALHYINGEFVHIEEYEYFSGTGTHVDLLLPGKEKGTNFIQYILQNL